MFPVDHLSPIQPDRVADNMYFRASANLDNDFEGPHFTSDRWVNEFLDTEPDPTLTDPLERLPPYASADPVAAFVAASAWHAESAALTISDGTARDGVTVWTGEDTQIHSEGSLVIDSYAASSFVGTSDRGAEPPAALSCASDDLRQYDKVWLRCASGDALRIAHVSITANRARGDLFNLYFRKNTSTKQPWITCCFRKRFPPEPTISSAIKSSCRLSKALSKLIKDEGLLDDQKDLLLQTFQAKYGRLWKMWRDRYTGWKRSQPWAFRYMDERDLANRPSAESGSSYQTSLGRQHSQSAPPVTEPATIYSESYKASLGVGSTTPFQSEPSLRNDDMVLKRERPWVPLNLGHNLGQNIWKIRATVCNSATRD
jgi:hypothetical protein